MPTLSFNATVHLLASYAVPVKLKFSELDAWCISAVNENNKNIKQYAQIDLGKNMLVYRAQVLEYVHKLETDTESVKDLAYKFKLDFSVRNKWEKIDGGKVRFFLLILRHVTVKSILISNNMPKLILVKTS